MRKPDLEPDVHSTNAMAAIVFAFGQVALFVGLHDLLLSMAIANGQPSNVNAGVGWGVMVQYSVYIFAAICFLTRFVTLSFISLPKFLFPLLGFAFFSVLFVDDLYYLRSFVHPNPAGLSILCAFAALVSPYLVFEFVTKHEEDSIFHARTFFELREQNETAGVK